MATTKKTSELKKTVITAAKKTTTTAAKKTVKSAATKATKKVTTKKKYTYIFFNCNDNKDVQSMNVRYNNEIFSDSAAGRKALLKKVEDEVAAGRVNVFDKEAVEKAILKGDPSEANSKIQYGDIERMIIMA